MRTPRFALALTLAVAFGCAAAIQSDERGDGGHPESQMAGGRPQLDALLDRINRRRLAIGCRRLAWDTRLAAVAQRHSVDMARRNFFSHTNPDGDDPFDRLRRAGIRYRNAAENLAEGQRTAEEVYAGWAGSPGHRRNMENCVYTRAGLGLADHCWTLVLTRPADPTR